MHLVWAVIKTGKGIENFLSRADAVNEFSLVHFFFLHFCFANDGMISVIYLAVRSTKRPM